MSALLTAVGVFAMQSGQVVLDRPLRAEPAGLGAPGHIEMALGGWYASSERADSIGTPAQIVWNASPRWQIRVQTAGFVGQSDGWIERTEFRDGQFGAQYQFIGVGGDPNGGWDAAVRTRFGCCPKKKQRAIFTGLLSRRRARSSLDMNVEVTIPFNEQSRGQIPLTGTLAFGGRHWWSTTWGGGAGYILELPDELRARHRFEAAVLARLSPAWVIDLGSEYQFAPWTRFVVKAGVSFYILSTRAE